MYSMLAHASNTGAIMLMKDLLWHWVPMFSSTGKHKYATHISRFLRDLHLIYPPQLSHVIKQHWLCNPTGTQAGFHGVDWWLECNNLYTKASYWHYGQYPFIDTMATHQVIFSGSNSNQSIQHIINQSSLIKIYHMIHVNTEDNFYVKSRSIWHAPTDM